jgi:hypothetical protein
MDVRTEISFRKRENGSEPGQKIKTKSRVRTAKSAVYCVKSCPREICDCQITPIPTWKAIARYGREIKLLVEVRFRSIARSSDAFRWFASKEERGVMRNAKL